jgi:hypothetical protein
VQDNELVITKVLEAHGVTREYYRDNPEGLEHYEEAVHQGMCMLIHEWSIGADDDEVDYGGEAKE